jgi:hypothetical protein
MRDHRYHADYAAGRTARARNLIGLFLRDRSHFQAESTLYLNMRMRLGASHAGGGSDLRRYDFSFFFN